VGYGGELRLTYEAVEKGGPHSGDGDKGCQVNARAEGNILSEKIFKEF
jgi:GTPase involved in cell partitioning and DNA repair